MSPLPDLRLGNPACLALVVASLVACGAAVVLTMPFWVCVLAAAPGGAVLLLVCLNAMAAQQERARVAKVQLEAERQVEWENALEHARARRRRDAEA